MICLNNQAANPLIENQRVRRSADQVHSVRMGVPRALAGARRGYPRNAVSVNARVKPVRFFTSKRLSSQLAGNWKLNAGLPGRGEGADAAAFPYVYRWDRQGRKGELCRMTARGSMNSCRVEFKDGFQMITSRNALRRVKP